MAEFLRIDVTGAQALRQQLGEALRRLDRPRELMEALAAVLEGNVQRRFDLKQDPQGNPWAPLAPSTRERYDAEDTVRRGRNKGQVRRRGTLLERTRQMRQSLTSAAGDDWAEVGMSRLTDGGKWSIPLLHETGTTRMPRRGIFLADWEAGTLGAEDEADLQVELQAFMDDLFGA